LFLSFFFFQVEDGIRDRNVTGVQTCALPISDFDLVLYGRNVSSRLSDKVSDRVLLVDGNFEEFDKIKENLVDVDAVYLNYVAGRSEERRVGKEFLYRRRIVIRRRAQHDVSQT